MHRFVTLVLILLAAATSVVAAGSRGPRQSVGLVLSGGGAKGIAHIGVIQALEDNDIPIDYITGTSMGAVVGGLYAAGYTPDEMLEMILSQEFADWSTGTINPSLAYYFDRGELTPAMVLFPLRSAAAADSVPKSLISGIPMSFAFMELFSAYTAQCEGDFNRLFVPFRSVASNVEGKHKHVFRDGRLSDAIRCSMTFPIVFQPIAVNDTLLYDGGIYDNFPVDVMRSDFAPSVMIGVNVSSSSSKGPQTSIMDQLDRLVIQGKLCELPDDEGIYMRIMLDQFSLLDFPRAREIYRIGYDHAMSMMDSIKGRVTSRTPVDVRRLRRRVFKSQSPYLRFDSVAVTGGTLRQNEHLQRIFSPREPADTFGIERARHAFYRAISSGKVADLYPTASYSDSTGLFTLNLKASVKGSFRGSLGGYISSSTSSYLYASVGYSSLNFSSVDATLGGWLGQTTMAGQFVGRLRLPGSLSTALKVEAVASRSKYYQSDHLFYSDKYPTFVVSKEYFGRIAWTIAVGRSGAVEAGAGYGSVRDSYYTDNRMESYTRGRSYSHRHLWQAFARYTANTLDEQSYPRRGYSLGVTAMAVTGTEKVSVPQPEDGYTENVSHPKWIQGEVRGRFYPELSSKVSLGIETDVMLSTRHLPPTFSAAITSAPAFCPTPSSNNAFRAPFRSFSFVAAGLVPVYNISSSLSVRAGGYAFMPLRRLRELPDGKVSFGKWLSRPEVYCEGAVAYHFPFGSLAGYVNYSTGGEGRWNVGLSFGIFILPPRFLR